VLVRDFSVVLSHRHIGDTFLQEPERGAHLRSGHFFSAKYVIFKGIDQLTRPYLFAHRLLVAVV